MPLKKTRRNAKQTDGEPDKKEVESMYLQDGDRRYICGLSRAKAAAFEDIIETVAEMIESGELTTKSAAVDHMHKLNVAGISFK